MWHAFFTYLTAFFTYFARIFSVKSTNFLRILTVSFTYVACIFYVSRQHFLRIFYSKNTYFTLILSCTDPMLVSNKLLHKFLSIMLILACLRRFSLSSCFVKGGPFFWCFVYHSDGGVFLGPYGPKKTIYGHFSSF